jgi:protein gp37
MADHSHIEWTDATWNPVTGCSVVSPGCTNCYAMTLAGTRLQHHPSRAGLTTPSKAGPVWTGEVRFNEQWLDLPLRWRRPRMVFVCAHGDLFHESVPDAWIDKVFAIMALAPQHTFQCLTKRSGRMRAYVTQAAGLSRNLGGNAVSIMEEFESVTSGSVKTTYPIRASRVRDEVINRAHGGLPNVWLGISAERQQEADARIPELLATPAAVRFVSLEPLLGPIDLNSIAVRQFAGEPARIDALRGWYPGNAADGMVCLDWVIVGGESGKAARPMHPDWARSLRDQCTAAQVPFFFKQWGEWAPGECADGPQTRTEPVAWHWDDRWSYGRLSPRVSEETHRDDEPDVYRLGKARAGRLLDGREWSGMP